MYRARRLFDGDPDGGGGGDAALQAKIDAAVAAATAGLKKTNADLKEEKRLLAEKAKAFDGLDLEEMKTVHTLFKDSEDLKLIKEGKIDEVLARRNEKFLVENEKKVKAANDAVIAAEARLNKYSQRVLDDSIRAAATKAGVHNLPGVIEDVILNARMDFTLNDEGNPVQMKEGAVVMGKDGKTPFSPDEWFSQKAESKPHWFPTGSSGADQGGTGGSAGGKTIKRSAFDALPPVERAKVSQTHRIVD